MPQVVGVLQNPVEPASVRFAADRPSDILMTDTDLNEAGYVDVLGEHRGRLAVDGLRKGGAMRQNRRWCCCRGAVVSPLQVPLGLAV